MLRHTSRARSGNENEKENPSQVLKYNPHFLLDFLKLEALFQVMSGCKSLESLNSFANIIAILTEWFLSCHQVTQISIYPGTRVIHT